MIKIKLNILIMVSLALLYSCSKDKDPGHSEIMSHQKQLYSFVFKATDNDALEEDIDGIINDSAKTILVTVPSGTDLTALVPAVEVSQNALVSPEGPQDFTSPVTYTVTAEDGTRAIYHAIVSIASGNQKQILSFFFDADSNITINEDIYGTIDEDNKTITAEVPSSADVKSLVPTFEISPGATVSPVGPRDFTNTVNFTVRAEDGSECVYSVIVSIDTGEPKQILEFVFTTGNNPALNEDVRGSIDETVKAIDVLVPYGTDITNLTPTIEVSPGASVAPEGPRDFTFIVNYTVTAGDLTQSIYKVKVTVIPSPSQREALTAIYLANPDNTLGWDLNDSSLGNWKGVTVDADGKVIKLDISDAEISVLPPEIEQLINLTSLIADNNQINTIPAELCRLGNLTILNLDNNQLNSIPVAINQLTELAILVLSNNQINFIPLEISLLEKLTLLNLENNRVSSIPPEAGRLANLNYLYLGNNQLSDIPVEICQLTKLAYLYLNNNQLTSVPIEIGQLTRLYYLALGYNQLSAVPAETGNLTNLTSLTLQNNQLTSIPVEIGQLTKLSILNLTNNQLTAIPAEVCDLETLYHTFISTDAGVVCQ